MSKARLQAKLDGAMAGKTIERVEITNDGNYRLHFKNESHTVTIAADGDESARPVIRVGRWVEEEL